MTTDEQAYNEVMRDLPPETDDVDWGAEVIAAHEATHADEEALAIEDALRDITISEALEDEMYLECLAGVYGDLDPALLSRMARVAALDDTEVPF